MATLFLAFSVPEAVAEALPTVWAHYGSVVAAPTAREKLHLTLLWLGPVDEAPVEKIKNLVEPLPQSFVPTVRLTHIGRGRRRDQLWAYGEAAGPVVNIREQLLERLRTLDWPVPKQGPRRPFTPHVTVASLYDQMSHVGVADYPFINSYTAEEVLLYKSTPTPNQPSTYSILERISLQ